MAKTVFRPQETVSLTSAYVIQGSSGQTAVVDVVPEAAAIEEYSGPTADDLRREAELFKTNWETEKEALVASARAEAGDIVAKAEAAAFEEVKRKSDQAQRAMREAEDAAQKAVVNAEARVKDIEAQARARIEEVQKDAFKKGFDEGRESGFKEGRGEVQRLVDRLHVILDRAMEKRATILDQTEGQIVELVLLISRKVVKVISENQKNVVISNISQALKKLKTRSDVIIHVNLADMQLATEHVKDFIQMAENAKRITVVEDTSVDRGGCVIETDFGEIDARIQSQLHELEDKILDIAPIKSRGKAQ